MGFIANLPEVPKEFVYVDKLNKLPKPVGNVITLKSNTTYFGVNDLDWLGNRIVIPDGTCAILGTSSENCIWTSTGLPIGQAFITCNYTLPIRHITFDSIDTCFNFDGTANVMALDWTGVNVTNCPNLGAFVNFDNFIINKCAFASSKGLIIDDSFDSLVIVDSLLSADGLAGSLLTIPATAISNRRIRIQDSSVIISGDTNGFDVSDSATIGAERYILKEVNFTNAGSTGSILVGADYLSNKAAFTGCAGIINSAKFANYYVSNNALATTIAAIGTPVKINAATTLNPLTQKFTHTNNRATYIGGLSGFFKVVATLSVTSTSPNDQLGFYIANNGVVIDESEMYVTTNNNNRAESVTIIAITELDPNDFLEVFGENNTAIRDFTVTFLNVIIESITIS